MKKTAPPFTIAHSTVQQGCVLHSPETAQAVAAIANAIAECAKAAGVLAAAVAPPPMTNATGIAIHQDLP